MLMKDKSEICVHVHVRALLNKNVKRHAQHKNMNYCLNLCCIWLKLQSNNKTHEHSFAPWQRFCGTLHMKFLAWLIFIDLEASNHIMLHVTRSRRIALPVLVLNWVDVCAWNVFLCKNLDHPQYIPFRVKLLTDTNLFATLTRWGGSGSMRSSLLC